MNSSDIKLNIDHSEIRELERIVCNWSITKDMQVLHKKYASGLSLKADSDDFVVKYVSNSGESIVPMYKIVNNKLKTYNYVIYSRFGTLLCETDKFDSARRIAYGYALQLLINNNWKKFAESYIKDNAIQGKKATSK